MVAQEMRQREDEVVKETPREAGKKRLWRDRCTTILTN